MRTRDRDIVFLLALAFTLLAVALAGCAKRGDPSPTRIVIYDHGQATAVEPQSSRFRAIGEQVARLVSQARGGIVALGFPWEAAARCTQEQVAVEVVFAEPGVQAGVHGAYTSALIPLDEEHEPGFVSVYLGRERYTLLVPARGDEALAALCELAGVPAPPIRTGPLPPTVAPISSATISVAPTAIAGPAHSTPRPSAMPNPCPPHPAFTPGPLTWRRVEDAFYGYSFEVPAGWLEAEHVTPDRLVFFSDPSIYGQPEFCPRPNGLIKLDFGADPPAKAPDRAGYTSTTIDGRPAWIYAGEGGEAAPNTHITSVYILGPEYGYLLSFGCTPPAGGSREDFSCQAVVDHVLADFRVTASQPAATPAAAGPPPIAAPQAVPPLTREQGLVYDTARSEVLQFGGDAGGPPEPGNYNQTWVWQENTWCRLQPATVPHGRLEPAMAFDQKRQVAVLFSGVPEPEAGLIQDTWLWDGQGWHEPHPPLSPPPREGGSMVYDAARGVVLLFGGLGELAPRTAMGDSVYLNDTWTWDGKAWTEQHPPVSPPPGLRLSMAYDAAQQEVFLFDQGTWTWDGRSWTEQHPAAGPSLGSRPVLGYDEARQQLVLFVADWQENTNQTWLWDGASWRRVSDASLPEDSIIDDGCRMVYDAQHQTLLLFALSGDKMAGFRASVWAWTGQGWQKVNEQEG